MNRAFRAHIGRFFMLLCLVFVCFTLLGYESRIKFTPIAKASISTKKAMLFRVEDSTRPFSYEQKKTLTPDFVLPKSLITIEEEAFEGTAITSIVLPGYVDTIGDYAFANIKTLRVINIPQSISFIGDNAFIGSNQVLATGMPVGYVNSWAVKSGVPFAPFNGFQAHNNSIRLSCITKNKSVLQKILIDNDTTVYQNLKEKRAGRMNGELNASRYESFTEFHIQGRSPPEKMG